MKKTPFLSLLVASLLVAGCDVKVNDKGFALNLGRAEASDEWTRTYDLSAGGLLEIVNVNGLIAATGSDGPSVEVRAERRARAGTEQEAGELLKKLDMREEVSATRVKIDAQDDGTSIQYHVRVPDGLAVSFRTANGNIRIQNVIGRITAATTNGGVQADLSSISGDVTVATTNGGVRLDLPTNVKASLDAACVNGGIDIDDEFKVDTGSDDSRCRVSAALNGGGPRISAATVNGSIRIRARGGRQTD